MRPEKTCKQEGPGRQAQKKLVNLGTKSPLQLGCGKREGRLRRSRRSFPASRISHLASTKGTVYMEAIQVVDWVAIGAILVLGVLAIHLRDVLKGALALAVLSAILAALFYRFGASYAAVFELSVCAGLITVLFVAVIALTEAREEE